MAAGVGIIATDLLIDEGGEMATLSPTTISRLDKQMSMRWSRANPVRYCGRRRRAALCRRPRRAGRRSRRRCRAGHERADIAHLVDRRGACDHGRRRPQGRAGDRLLDRRARGPSWTRRAARCRHSRLRHAAARGPRLHAHRRVSPRPACAAADAAVRAGPAVRYGARAVDRAGGAGRKAQGAH